MYKNTVVKYINAKKPKNKLTYGTLETPDYGKMFAAFYLEGTSLYRRLQFALDQTIEIFAKDLQKLWPKTLLFEDDKLTKKVFAKYIIEQDDTPEIYVVLMGSDFQLKVWAALLEISFGEERTYGEIAAMISNSKAARAVGNAVGSNKIAIFVPCHRVKASKNDNYKYGAGSDLKKNILLNEKNRK